MTPPRARVGTKKPLPRAPAEVFPRRARGRRGGAPGAHAALCDEAGHRLVVGNGFHRVRTVTTGAGALEVRAPRVDDRREGEKFSSAVLPAYMRKSPQVTEG